MKNILLVIPKFAKFGEEYHFPLGLAYISSYLKSKKYPVFNLNLCHSDVTVREQIIKAIKKNKIEIIATGGISFWWNEIYDIIDSAKNYDPNIITIAGGAIVTSEPELIMKNMKIDYGIIGEGELTIYELCLALNNGADLLKIPGLIYFDNNRKLIRTEPRKPIMDLDSLPFPDYEGFELGILLDTMENSEDKYLGASDNPRPVEIIASRSCPYNCTFCYHPLGRTYRQRSLDNLFEEIELLIKKYRINIINLLDELFSVKEKRVYEFADRIKKYSISWVANFRVNEVNDALIKKIKDSNALIIFYGIESLSNKILKSMNKKITREEIENALELSYKNNLTALGHIIIGDVEETQKTALESINWWKEHPEYRIELNFVLAVPDSIIYRHAIKNKIITNKLDHIQRKFPVVNLTKMSDKEFKKIYREVNLFKYTMKYVWEGKILGLKTVQNNKSGILEYIFKVECPFCKKHTIFNRSFNGYHPYIQLICRNCMRIMKIPRNQIFYKEFSKFSTIIRVKIENLIRIFIIKYSFPRKIFQGIKFFMQKLKLEGLLLKAQNLLLS